jgi:hypothetical protein
MSNEIPSLKSVQRAGIAVQEMDALRAKVSMGYGAFDIWGPSSDLFSWGLVNDRGLFLDRKNRMYASIMHNSLQNTRNDTVIKIMMRASWFECDLLPQLDESMPIDQMPRIRLTAEGKAAAKADQVKPLEGLGRRGGAELLVQRCLDDIKKREATIIKLGSGKDKDDDKESIAREYKLIEVAKNVMRNAHLWTFHVLDLGEW